MWCGDTSRLLLTATVRSVRSLFAACHLHATYMRRLMVAAFTSLSQVSTVSTVATRPTFPYLFDLEQNVFSLTQNNFMYHD